MHVVQVVSRSDAASAHLQLGGGEPLRRLIQLAYRGGCRTILVLPGVTCDQWDSESQALFDDIAHQLSGDVSLLVFLHGAAADTGEATGLLKTGKVRGYAFIRPQPLAPVVESFISPTLSSDVHFMTCEADFNLTLPGNGESINVSLHGLPFMQQDGMVSRCADASLWIATTLLRGSHPDWSKSAQPISYKASVEALQYTHPSTRRRLPSGGLAFEEVLLILSRLGYDPFSYVFTTPEQQAKSDHTVYRWVESGLPVILWLQLESDFHTVVVSGHTFDPDAWWPGARTDYFPSLAKDDRWLSSSLWAVEYLVLDDNYGPMLAMTRGSLRNRAIGAIIPVPKAAKILLAPEDAEDMVASLLFGNRGVAVPNFAPSTTWSDALCAATLGQRERFVLRTFLVRSEQLKSYWGSSGYPAEVQTAASTVDWPDYCWLCEISLPSIYGDKLKIGEVVLDPRIPSGMHKRGIESLVWLNWAGQIFAPASQYVPLNEAVPLMPR